MHVKCKIELVKMLPVLFQISVYDEDPSEFPASPPLLTFQPSLYPESFLTTNLTVPQFNFSAAATITTCLGYYVTYSRDDVTEASTCLQQRPNWMELAKADLRTRYLDQLMIPGAHDSAAYKPYEGKKTDESLSMRYASAQEEPLLSQFFMGVRYFDTRVAFYPTWKDPFWVSHGIIPFRPYVEIVDDIVEMIERTKEIVIYEIGGFEGTFSSHPEAYNDLLDIILPRLERWLVPVPEDDSKRLLLGNLWAADRRLVLSWDGPTGKHSNVLWPRIPNSWNNDNTPGALYKTLESYVANAPINTIWSLAAEMTEHASDVIFDRLESLRTMADQVNRNISQMVQRDWWDQTNIVQSDFFASSYHVDTAILANWQRVHCT